jgi:hypothetical protein
VDELWLKRPPELVSVPAPFPLAEMFSPPPVSGNTQLTSAIDASKVSTFVRSFIVSSPHDTLATANWVAISAQFLQPPSPGPAKAQLYYFAL